MGLGEFAFPHTTPPQKKTPHKNMKFYKIKNPLDKMMNAEMFLLTIWSI